MNNPLSHVVTFKSFRPDRYKEIVGHLPGNIEAACQLVENEAKDNVSQSGGKHPQIQTGALLKGIQHRIWRKGQTIKGYIGIARDQFYGRMLEFGTIKMPPYPWLYPALKAKEKEIDKLLRGR